MTTRVFRRVDLEHTLFMPGGRAPTTRPKRWFFDVPSVRDTKLQWTELLHRVFYDANVRLQRREPGDPNWLGLVSFEVSPLEPATMLAWNGEATKENAEQHLPWMLAHSAIVWEQAACYWVDEGGAYDGMSGNDFAELQLYRALELGTVDAAGAIAFLAKLYPGKGVAGARELLADRTTRQANLESVRPATGFRKRPGSLPVSSGPPSPADLSGG